MTDSRLKNELLFSEYNTNYNNEAEINKKGTIIYKEKVSMIIYLLPIPWLQ